MVAGHVLEICAGAFSDWNEKDDRQRAQEARHDPWDTVTQDMQFPPLEPGGGWKM